MINFRCIVGTLTILFLFFQICSCAITCKCNDHLNCKSNNYNKNLHCNITGEGNCYAAKVVEIVNENSDKISAKIFKRYGCLSTTHTSILTCKGHFSNFTLPTAIECCNKTNYCNEHLNPKFSYHKSEKDALFYALSQYINKQQSTTTKPTISRHATYVNIIIAVGVVCGIICIIPAFFILFYRKKIQNHIKNNKSRLRNCQSNTQSRYSEEREMRNHDGAYISLQNGSIMNSGMIGSSLMTNSTSIPGGGFSGGAMSINNTLIQRRIGHQIVIRELLGKGRFGEVWSGEWMDQPVTVRLLTGLIGEKLWLRTIRLYYSCILQHSGILGLLGSDRMEYNACTVRPMLLYPHYSLGTLLQLMSASYWDRTVEESGNKNSDGLGRLETLSKMSNSIVAGLCYLHTEIAATKGKPAIAHRNLKTSNIYVKEDYSCCIGDLEWALVASSAENRGSISMTTTQSAISGWSSTPTGLVTVPGGSSGDLNIAAHLMTSANARYLAPELLRLLSTSSASHMVNHKTVDDHKRADIYSLSLILWEMVHWFELADPAISDDADSSSYVPVYQEELDQYRNTLSDSSSHDSVAPSISEMTHLVVNQQTRPSLLHYHQSTNTTSASADSILAQLCHILPQCWTNLPESRINCFNIKRYLSPLPESFSETTALTLTSCVP